MHLLGYGVVRSRPAGSARACLTSLIVGLGFLVAYI